MEDELGCSVRTYAIAGLVTYALTVLLGTSTLKFPGFGTPSHVTGESFRLPPEDFFAFLLGVFTIGVSVMLVVACIKHSFANRRWVWLSVFIIAIVAGLLGLVALIAGSSLSPSAGGVVAYISALGVLLTLLATLFYSIRSPAA